MPNLEVQYTETNDLTNPEKIPLQPVSDHNDLEEEKKPAQFSESFIKLFSTFQPTDESKGSRQQLSSAHNREHQERNLTMKVGDESPRFEDEEEEKKEDDSAQLEAIQVTMNKRAMFQNRQVSADHILKPPVQANWWLNRSSTIGPSRGKQPSKF